jgi:hypothetical protein
MYVQLIIHTERQAEGNWHASAHRTDKVRRYEYLGVGKTEEEAAANAVKKLINQEAT